MKILAVDSSTMMSSIALLEDDDIIASYNINQKRSHGENLIPMIKNLLDFSGLDIKDIDLFATGIGPGSFLSLIHISEPTRRPG